MNPHIGLIETKETNQRTVMIIKMTNISYLKLSLQQNNTLFLANL